MKNKKTKKELRHEAFVEGMKKVEIEARKKIESEKKRLGFKTDEEYEEYLWNQPNHGVKIKY